MPTFVMSAASEPNPEPWSTVGLRESAKLNPTKCMRIVTCIVGKGINYLLWLKA